MTVIAAGCYRLGGPVGRANRSSEYEEWALGALDGIRVLDFSRVASGPYATMVLGDHGADVVKVEEPGRGDECRGFAPHLAGESTYFLSVNRNKRSVVLDLRAPDSREALRKLLPEFDVVVHNYRPRFAARCGLGWDDLRAANPRLVGCSIAGWGSGGPYADRPAYDLFVAGVGGLMSVTGEPDGPPQRPGVNLVDFLAATHAVIGILLALQARERTGRGQLVEVSMLDSLLSASGHLLGALAATGKVPRPASHSQSAQIVPYGTFRTADGYVNVGALNERSWRKLCEALRRREWIEDPRFLGNELRARHRDDLLGELRPIFRARTSAEWLRILEGADVPCGPINSFEEVMRDPQVVHNGALTAMPHPTCGAVLMVAPPVRLSDTPAELRMPPPLLGQHTEEVLGELPDEARGGR